MAKSNAARQWASKLQRRERKTRADLRAFIKAAVAVADDIAAERDASERALLLRHRDHFTREAARLTEILGDHPHADVREHRLFMLAQLLGSVSVIANRYSERIECRLKVDTMVTGKLAKSAAIDERIAAAAMAIRREHPTWSRWRVAGEISAMPGMRGRRAVYRRLKK